MQLFFCSCFKYDLFLLGGLRHRHQNRTKGKGLFVEKQRKKAVSKIA